MYITAPPVNNFICISTIVHGCVCQIYILKKMVVVVVVVNGSLLILRFYAFFEIFLNQ